MLGSWGVGWCDGPWLWWVIHGSEKSGETANVANVANLANL